MSEPGRIALRAQPPPPSRGPGERRRILANVLAAAVLLSAAPALAVRPLTPPAPEFPEGDAWYNSQELTMKRLLKRRVVVVSFLNFTSLNSIRTFGALRTWWDRYSQEGLMIVGVHTPDYESDKDIAGVRAAIKRFGLRFPIVVDNDRRIWDAYANAGWPSHYLVDSRGLLIFDRMGEGGYREFESELRDALQRFNRYRPPRDAALGDDPPAADCGDSTPLRYVGARRGRLLNLEGVRETQRVLTANRDGEVSYRGRWTLEPDALRLARDNPGLNDYLRLIYRGAEAVSLTGSEGGRPTKVFVKQDDIWLHANNAGQDVQWDTTDRSFVVVSGTRLYYIAKNEDDNMHELVLEPSEAGLGFQGFDFSNRCQTQYDHK